MKRKSGFILLAYITGILLYYVNLNIYFYFIAILFFLLSFLKERVQLFLLFSTVCLLSFFRFKQFNHNFPSDLSNKFVHFQGIIVNKNESKDYYKVKIQKVNENNRIIYAQLKSDENYMIGNKIEGMAKIQQARESMNPGDFNYKNYLASRGMFAVINTKSPLEIIDDSNSLLLRLRKSIKDYLYDLDGVKDIYKPFFRSVFIGENTLDEDFYSNIKSLGLAHILAISGLHIGLLFSLIMLISGYVDRYVVYFLSLLTIFLYGFAIDFPPSIKRALILLAMYYLAECSRKPYERITVLFSSLLLILVINPYELFAVGLQFSFIATFTVFWKEDTIKKLNGLSKVAYTSTYVYFMLLPLQLYYFKSLSLGFLVGNLFLLPIFTLVILIGFLYYILWPIQGILASCLNLLMNCLIYITKGASNFGLDFKWSRPTLGLIIFYYLLIFSMTTFHQWKRLSFKNKELLFKMTAIALIIPILITLYLDPIYITQWYIGQGDSALINHRNYNILIDTGGNYYRTNNQLENILEQNNIKKIHLAFISHFDDDHVGNLKDISNKVELVVSRKDGNKILNEKYGMSDLNYQEIHHGDYFTLGAIKTYVYNNIFARNENDLSIVLKIQAHNFSLLFTGDIEEESEKFLEDFDIRANILKVAHHGSDTSSREEFIKAVNPSFAIISCGIENTYGFPNKNVLERFSNFKIPIYRTDTDGAIVIKINKLGYEITSNLSLYNLRDESIALLFAFALVYIVNYMNKEDSDVQFINKIIE